MRRKAAAGGHGVRRLGITCAAALMLGQAAVAEPRLPGTLVHLRAVDPRIVQEIRYATPQNFTGAEVPGYAASECILTRETAMALRQVQSDLEPRGLALKVFDCYRPTSAVQAFVRWAGMATAEPRAWHHPNVPRAALVRRGYIASQSGHSRGDTVDLTLVPIGAPVAATDEAGRSGDCTRPASADAGRREIDMGTAFDCFDERSHTASGLVSGEQRRWRETLVNAMKARGFRNYSREWWHFTYGRGDGPSYDVPVGPAPSGKIPSPQRQP